MKVSSGIKFIPIAIAALAVGTMSYNTIKFDAHAENNIPASEYNNIKPMNEDGIPMVETTPTVILFL